MDLRKTSAWRVLGFVAAGLGAATVAVCLWINTLAERRWAETLRRIDALLLETRGRDPARPVLVGQATPGDAWDDYRRALDELGRIRSSLSGVERFLGRDPKADRRPVEELLTTYAAAFEHLQRGARRARGAYPGLWEDATGLSRLPGMRQSEWLVQLSACRARVLAEAGATREAMELMLDLCQFGHDLGQNGAHTLGVTHAYATSLEELRDLVTSMPMTREELLDLERAMEIADRSFTSTEVWMKNEVLKFSRAVLPSEEVERTGTGFRRMWRFAFSRRLLRADAFDKWYETATRSSLGDVASWAEVQRENVDFRKRFEEDKNPVVLLGLPWNFGAVRWARELRAQMRLLRLAARYRATGEILTLPDPFGETLLHLVAEGRLKAWSAGPDGQDDGGHDGGGMPWWTPKYQSISMRTFKDIVIQSR